MSYDLIWSPQCPGVFVDQPLLPIMFGEQYQSRSFSICDFFQYLVTSCLFGPVGNDNQVIIFASDFSVDDTGHKEDWWWLQGGQQHYSTRYSCDVVTAGWQTALQYEIQLWCGGCRVTNSTTVRATAVTSPHQQHYSTTIKEGTCYV